MEYAFTIINPWAMQWKNSILGIMDIGFVKRAAIVDIPSAPRNPIEIQYLHQKEKPFYKPIVDAISEKEIFLAIYVGGHNNFYQVMYENKQKARNAFATYIQQPNQALFPGLKFFAVHCSESRLEANRELSGWKHYLEENLGFPVTSILKKEGVKL